MEIKVFNRDLELISIIDSFTSLRWVRRYYKSGEFELHLPLNIDVLESLKKDNIIYIDGDEAGYIEDRNLSLGESGEELLVCKGKFLTSYLNRRINWNKVVYSGTTEGLIRHLVNINAINPSDSQRKINNLNLGSLSNLPDKIDYQNSYGDLLECIESISMSSNYGFKIEFDYLSKTLNFKVYSGRDLSINQSNYAPCLFSREFENILNQTYTDSINNLKTTCLIAGAGEDEARKKTTIGNDKIGLDRFELFVDARELSDTEYVDETEQEIPWDRYEPILIQKGNERLSEYKTIDTFESEVNLRSNVKYREDFDLGDIVTCFDKKWGITIDTRITEIEEIYEENGLEVNVTFGDSIPTLIEKIKSKLR